MRNLIAIAASVFINAGALTVIAAGITQSATPDGKVYVTQLTTDLTVLAQVDERAVRSL